MSIHDLQRVFKEEGYSWELVELSSFFTEGKPGQLIVAEIENVTDGLFEEARRVYWIVNNTQGWSERGGHYHPVGGKQEFMVCLFGRAIFTLEDADKREVYFELSGPNWAVVIPSGVWHSVELSPGAILLSVASTNFESDEAITNKPYESERV